MILCAMSIIIDHIDFRRSGPFTKLAPTLRLELGAPGFTTNMQPSQTIIIMKSIYLELELIPVIIFVNFHTL